LLFLIFHGSKHAWKRLKWLTDIHEILGRQEVDLGYVRYKAKEFGMTHMLVQTVMLIDRLFLTDHMHRMGLRPSAVSEKLADMALVFINDADKGCDQLGDPMRPCFERYLYAWNHGFLRKIRLMASRFSPNPLDFEAVRFDDRFFFMYYFIRPFLILLRLLKAGKKANDQC